MMGCHHSINQHAKCPPPKILPLYSTVGATELPYTFTVPRIRNGMSISSFEIELTTVDTIKVLCPGSRFPNGVIFESLEGRKIALITESHREYRIFSIDSPSFETQKSEKLSGLNIYLYASFHIDRDRQKDSSTFLVRKANESVPGLLLDPFSNPMRCYRRSSKSQQLRTIAGWYRPSPGHDDQINVKTWSDDSLFIVCLVMISFSLHEEL